MGGRVRRQTTGRGSGLSRVARHTVVGGCKAAGFDDIVEGASYVTVVDDRTHAKAGQSVSKHVELSRSMGEHGK